MNKFLIRLPGSVLAGCFLWQVLVPGSVQAQYYDDPGLGQRPVAAHPPDYKPLGIRAGVFMLHPGVQLAGEYTDNVFYATDNTESDTVFHVRPYITAQSTWRRHSLNISLAADIARYADFDERDYEDYFLGADGRIDVKERSFFTYTLDYLDLHEGLNNRASEQGIEPTRYDAQGVSAGYNHTFNRLSLLAKYAWRQLNFANVLAADGGFIDNQDRDRENSTVSLRAGYQFQTDKQAFVSYSAHNVKYDEPLDRSGLNRESDGYTVSGGLTLTITGKLNGDISVNYHDQSFDDGRLPDVNGWAAGAGLQWNPTEMTAVYGHIASGIEETTDQNSSGFLQTVYSLRLDHELTREIQLSGYVAYRDNDYQPIDTTAEVFRTNDHIFLAGLGVNWFINRHAYLNASYAYETLSSSLPGDDYNVNTFWLVLGLER
jgi:hypothetical protein